MRIILDNVQKLQPGLEINKDACPFVYFTITDGEDSEAKRPRLQMKNIESLKSKIFHLIVAVEVTEGRVIKIIDYCMEALKWLTVGDYELSKTSAKERNKGLHFLYSR